MAAAVALAAGSTTGAGASSPAPPAEAHPTGAGTPAASAGDGRAARDGGTWYLVTKHGGKCLTANGAGRYEGAVAGQYDCVRHANQRWQVLYTGTDGTAYLRAERGGKCLVRQGGSGGKGTKMIQWDCNGRGNKTTRAPRLTGYVAFKPSHATCCSVRISLVLVPCEAGHPARQRWCRRALPRMAW
ncbi:RICIN domain-containing protein [Streptomyces nogalater]|uniref:RICIN domain-containing protein n=1 Tax=Streptomyces nogalater TaxID=38314 RepID=A0ABW0WQ76_STRNO